MASRLELIETSTRYDCSKLWDIHSEYFMCSGIGIWKRGEIPYSGVSNYQEAYKKAQFFVANLLNFEQSGQIKVLEVGAGYGEFARNFLRAMRDICEAGDFDFYDRLDFYLSDYSDSILEELQASGRLDEFASKITFVKYDAWTSEFSLQAEAIPQFDLVLANYLLDQFPARVFACKQGQYYEQYLALRANANEIEKYQAGTLSRKWIKKIKKDFEFQEIDLHAAADIPEEELRALLSCFRHLKDSTVTYSYGALKVLKSFLALLSPKGIIICSDFNAASRGGVSPYEACYYGNSLAQGVNFEFLNRYFIASKPVILYEDPIRPLHTLILTREDFAYDIELGEIYESVYKGNWLLKVFFRYMLELQMAFWIFAVILFAMALFYLLK